MEKVYWGSREAMIAEVSAFDPRRADIPAADCRYLVMPAGEGQWDTEGFGRKADAKAEAQAIASHYGVKAVFIA